VGDGIIGERAVLPYRADGRIGGNSELRDEPRHHARESRIVEESGAREIVASVRSTGRPRTLDLEHEISFARLDADVEDTRSARFPKR
jgi:hypothetical protein